MLYFYSGYVLNKQTGQQVATSHGTTDIPESVDVIEAATYQMLYHYNGPFPKNMLSVHIISLNKVY